MIHAHLTITQEKNVALLYLKNGLCYAQKKICEWIQRLQNQKIHILHFLFMLNTFTI